MNFSTRLHTRQSQVFRMGHVISVFEMSGDELEEHLLQAARNNPFLVIRRRRAGSGHSSVAHDQHDAGIADAPTSLYDHVLRELAGLCADGGAMERLVLALVEDLEPTGWLGRSIAEIAVDLKLSEDLVERGLRLVQRRVTPAGLFARDLRDCLRLQLDDQGLWDSEIEAVLGCLGLLEHGGVQEISAATGLSAETVTRHLGRIRRLDPKPGTRFGSDLSLMREPDVRVEPRGDGWVAIPKQNFETQVSLLSAARAGSSPEMRQALAQARTLKQALDLRQSALQDIMRVILDVQGAFFRDGPEALRPLTLTMIAQRTGFHLSTVSRVLNGLLVEGPNGIVEARVLCVRSCGRTDQNCPSKPRVLSRLRRILAAESPAQPMSDQRLAELLSAEGLAVSRRVVAKYRHELGFSSAGDRRQRA